MLARRFTITVLLITIFGALFSILVAKTARPARSWETGTVVPCAFGKDAPCAPSRNQASATR